jgi:hemoglobin
MCSSAGGPVLYTGHDNKISHKRMCVNEQDWAVFIEHLKDTLDKFELPDQEQSDMLGFVESTKVDIVE